MDSTRNLLRDTSLDDVDVFSKTCSAFTDSYTAIVLNFLTEECSQIRFSNASSDALTSTCKSKSCGKDDDKLCAGQINEIERVLCENLVNRLS